MSLQCDMFTIKSPHEADDHSGNRQKYACQPATMLQIVGALILLIAGFAILRLLFRALTSTASALAGFKLLCLFGPALLAGYITERITRLSVT